MPNNTTYNRRRAVAAGVLLAVPTAIVGGQIVNDYKETQKAKQAETEYFSQPDLVERFKQPADPNKNPLSKYGQLVIYKVMEGDATYWDISRKLGATDRRAVIDEMQGQAGEVLHAGDEIVLPVSQLGNRALVADESNVLPANSVFGNSEQAPGDNVNATVSYVIPATEVTDMEAMTYVIPPK